MNTELTASEISARWDSILDKWTYWTLLRKAKAEFDSTHRYIYFEDWMVLHYGIKIKYDISGKILPTYDIVTPPKYSFFLLKFS